MQILTNWEEFGSIKKWKKGLKHNSNRNKFSAKTDHQIKFWMPLFTEYTQKNPDELIEEALNGKETVRARLSDFCTWLQEEKGKKYNASINGAYSVIRGFYAHNDINTQKIRIPRLEPSIVQFSDDQLPLFEIVQEGDKKRKKIRREFLQEFFGYLNPRDKIIALCLLSSGLDTGDLLKIPLALIRYQDPSQKRIFIRDLRNKTGETVTTFFSKEASKLVRSYVKMNRTNAQDTDMVFVKLSKELKKGTHEKLDPHTIADNFRDAVDAYNSESQERKIPLQAKKQSPLRPKRFRKIFNDACDDAGIPLDIKRVFMGKKDAANKPYEGRSMQDLEIYYEKIEPNLTIYSVPVETSELNEFKKKLEDEMKQKLDKLNENQLKQEKELQKVKDHQFETQKVLTHTYIENIYASLEEWFRNDGKIPKGGKKAWNLRKDADDRLLDEISKLKKVTGKKYQVNLKEIEEKGK